MNRLEKLFYLALIIGLVLAAIFVSVVVPMSVAGLLLFYRCVPDRD